MNQKDFEDNYQQLIPQAPLGDIINLFEKKKKTYNNKLSLFFQKIKDKLSKDKYSHFIELGYSPYSIVDFTRKFFELALNHNRADMIEYMFINNYANSMGEGFYLTQVVAKENVLKHILSNKEITEKITTYEYSQMLLTSVRLNNIESFDLICNVSPDKIKQIKEKQQIEILLSCAKCNAQEMLEKLLNMQEPLKFDISSKEEDPFGVIHTRENLLILAAKNDNTEMMRYLLTSPNLKKNVDLADSFWWIEMLSNAKQVIDDIILDIKAPLTPNMETILENSPYLEIFKKRDLMLKIEEKLPPKQIKIKTRKI